MNELIMNMAVAIILSAIIGGTYYYVHKDTLVEEMILTLLLLPIVVCTILYTIGNNVAGAFSLAGIFTIVRFRSTQASPKDITYILMGVAAGLTSATGFYTEGFILIFVSIIIILVFERFMTKKTNQILKILVPEDLADDKEVEEVLRKYTKFFALEGIQTKDLGSLFELVYRINLEKDTNPKKMIDDLRIVNGNLTIKISK